MNPELRIIYSIDARLGGHGIGTIAFHAAAAIFRRGWLTRCCISSNAQDTIPARLIRQWGMIGRATKYLAVKDATGAVDLVERELFDIWLAKQLFGFDIFHG